MRMLVSAALAVAGLLSATPAMALTEDLQPAIRGTWVPVAATCASPLKVTIGPRIVTFENGAQRAEYRKLETCVSCMGRDVTNMMLLSTDAMGDSPWMLTIDSRKKMPVISVDMSNDKKLAARFPFAREAVLKRCP